MKLRSLREGLGIQAIFAALLEVDTIVSITANRTVNKAGAGAVAIGFVRKKAAAIGGKGSVETRFKALVDIKFDGAVVAGDRVIMAAPDGDGIQRVKKWTAQSVTTTTAVDSDLASPYVTGAALAGDSPDLIVGVCFNGGADGATGEVLFY